MKTYIFILNIVVLISVKGLFTPLQANKNLKLIDTLSIYNLIVQLDTTYLKIPSNSKLQYQKIIASAESINYVYGVMQANYRLGSLYKIESQNDSAIITYKKAYYAAQELDDKIKLSRLCGKLGVMYNTISNYNLSKHYFLKGRKYFWELKDTSFYVVTGNNLAVCYRYMGQLDSSLYVLKENEKLLKKLNDPKRLGSCLHLQGVIARQQGNIKASLECFYNALNELKYLNDPVVSYIVKVDIADVYNSLGEHENALKLLNEIKNGYVNRIRSDMSLYKMMGIAFEGLNKRDSAIYYYKKSLDEAINLGQKGKVATAYYYIGNILFNTGRQSEALYYLKKSKLISNSLNLENDYATASNVLGNIYMQKGEFNMAEKNFTIAFNTGKKIGNIELLKNATKGLHLVNFQKGEINKAYNYLLKYKQYSDSVLNADNIKAITKKKLEFDFEKEKDQLVQEQEKERLLYNANIKRQKLVRNAIIIICLLVIIFTVFLYKTYIQKKKANNEKEALLKEIHHRVKNNLQIISSLLNIQTEYTKDLKIIGAVQESQSRVKAMALIHQLLYQEENFTRINFENYLDQLVKTINSIFKKEDIEVRTILNIDKIPLNIDTSIPLGLIVTELASNAYKYAFNDSKLGILEIDLLRTDFKRYELVIKDNGPGLPTNLNIENSNSLGLRLVNLLTNQIDGEFAYANKNGSQFKITFSEV